MESQTFTREELFDIVWSEPLSSLAKKYKISDVGLRKICIRMDVPLPRAGYWLTKMDQHNMPIVKPTLSRQYSGQGTVQLEMRSEASRAQMGKPSIEKLTQQEIEQDIASLGLGTKALNIRDPLIIKTKNALGESRVDSYSYIGTVNCGRMEGLDTRVSKKNVSRALGFWNVFSKALNARGHSLILKDDGTYIKIGITDYKVWLREKCIKVVSKDGEWKHGEYKPIGKFCFTATKNWNDGSEKLENMISRIIADVEVRYKTFKEMRERWDREKAEREEKELISAEMLKRKEKELNEFKKILKKAKRWHKANVLRNYLKTFKNEKTASGGLTKEEENWIEWGEKKADWYDPFVESFDSLMEDVDRDSLSLNEKERPRYGFL